MACPVHVCLSHFSYEVGNQHGQGHCATVGAKVILEHIVAHQTTLVQL
jgi:hypothetical protein